MTRETLNRSQREAAALIHHQLSQLIKMKQQTDDENAKLQEIITDLSNEAYNNKRKEEKIHNLSNVVERCNDMKNFSSGFGV